MLSVVFWDKIYGRIIYAIHLIQCNCQKKVKYVDEKGHHKADLVPVGRYHEDIDTDLNCIDKNSQQDVEWQHGHFRQNRCQSQSENVESQQTGNCHDDSFELCAEGIRFYIFVLDLDYRNFLSFFFLWLLIG